MAGIKIVHTTDKKRDEIWRWVEQTGAQTIQRKIPREEITLTPVPDENRFDLKGKNISATINIKDNEISFNITVPILYRAFAPVIEASVKSVLADL